MRKILTTMLILTIGLLESMQADTFRDGIFGYSILSNAKKTVEVSGATSVYYSPL